MKWSGLQRKDILVNIQPQLCRGDGLKLCFKLVLLGIPWNVLICTEKSTLAIPHELWVGSWEKSQKNIFGRNCLKCYDLHRHNIFVIHCSYGLEWGSGSQIFSGQHRKVIFVNHHPHVVWGVWQWSGSKIIFPRIFVKYSEHHMCQQTYWDG